MISVLCVNYHSASELADLAESLRLHSSGHDVELIVTNNSPSETLDVSRAPDLRVTVLPSENVGFAAGINLALRRAVGDILFVANPDVRVMPGALDAAVRFLGRQRDVGIVLPLLRYPDGTLQQSVRRFYTWPVVFYARSPLRTLRWRPGFFRRYLCESLDRSGPTDVDWGLGGAMFLRRADLGDGPLFDERFFLYFEDVDVCLRIWRRGLRVVHCPEIECVHAHRRLSRSPLTRAGLHHLRSLLRFIIKHRGLPQRPRGESR
jgi:N-acetylglucosaminyl-diphospho-decaprenol L-rhamnosyltransferase